MELWREGFSGVMRCLGGGRRCAGARSRGGRVRALWFAGVSTIHHSPSVIIAVMERIRAEMRGLGFRGGVSSVWMLVYACRVGVERREV